jgi:hypothetical protein
MCHCHPPSTKVRMTKTIGHPFFAPFLCVHACPAHVLPPHSLLLGKGKCASGYLGFGDHDGGFHAQFALGVRVGLAMRCALVFS